MSMWFPALRKVAVLLLSMHTTACFADRNWSKWGLVYSKNHGNLPHRKAGKIFFFMEFCDIAEGGTMIMKCWTCLICDVCCIQ